MKALLIAWLALMPMTLAGVWLGDHERGLLLAVLAILLLALGKAWIIVLRFMELQHGPSLWRALLLGWPLTLAVAILVIHATH